MAVPPDLAGIPLIQQATRPHLWADWLSAAGLDTAGIRGPRFEQFEMVVAAARAGLGVAVLPGEAIRPHLRSMNLRQIALQDDWAKRRLLIGVRDAAAVPRHVRLLIDHLCAARTEGSTDR